MAQYYKEGFLLQLIAYSAVWLINDYIGLLLCLIVAFIAGGLLIFAVLAELVQKSKVPRAYFIWMGISIVCPLIITISFSLLFEGQFDWIPR